MIRDGKITAYRVEHNDHVRVGWLAATKIRIERGPQRGRTPALSRYWKSKIFRKIPGATADSGFMNTCGSVIGPSILKVTPNKPSLGPAPSASPRRGICPKKLLIG